MSRPGPGHNNPPDPGFAYRRHVWARAKAEMRPPPMTPTQVRLRMARATELGLSFAQLSSIRMATGRDPRALLFSPEALSLRLTRQLDMPGVIRDKLATLRHCHLLAFSPEEEPAEIFLDDLRRAARVGFAAAAPMPPVTAGWGKVRATVLPMLRTLGLPGDATLMIGNEAGPGPGWAAAIRAPFLDAAAYFAPQAA